jgi:hypothetical protein
LVDYILSRPNLIKYIMFFLTSDVQL